jgi:hypothetical protein
VEEFRVFSSEKKQGAEQKNITLLVGFETFLMAELKLYLREKIET